jgi:hypothetical protein
MCAGVGPAYFLGNAADGADAIVLQLAQANPEFFDMKKVLARSLKQMKIPDINEIMKNVPAPEQRTSADENAAMFIGQAAYAYMPQDHIAHIQTTCSSR